MNKKIFKKKKCKKNLVSVVVDVLDKIYQNKKNLKQPVAHYVNHKFNN